MATYISIMKYIGFPHFWIIHFILTCSSAVVTLSCCCWKRNCSPTNICMKDSYDKHTSVHPNLVHQTLHLAGIKMMVAVRDFLKPFTTHTWHVIMTKGEANQSWSNTWPSGQMKVRLKPTSGAGVKSRKVGHQLWKMEGVVLFSPAPPKPT